MSGSPRDAVRTIAAALAAALLLVACDASTEPSDVVRVAVLDAGVSSELPEFDCFRIVGAPAVGDDHGTAMAGLVLGVLDDPCPPWSDRVTTPRIRPRTVRPLP